MRAEIIAREKGKAEIELRGKEIGFIRANGETPPIYISFRKKAKHYFRKYDGYGISTNILRLLKDSNVNKIVIIEERESGERRKLTTTANTFYEKGIRYNNKKDRQIILKITNFKWEE